MKRKMERRPVQARCSHVDEYTDETPSQYCRALATHAIPLTEYDPRTGKESVWWELVCEDHLDGDVTVELHECEFRAPRAEDDEP
jgi:hypothetical protein